MPEKAPDMTARYLGFLLLALLLMTARAGSFNNVTAAGADDIRVTDKLVIPSGATGTLGRMAQATKAQGSMTEQATAASANSGGSDGFSNAPLCTIQHPSLLSRYRIRPRWRVAGVDYCVGYATGTVLKNPATISISGVSVNRAKKVITVTGDNVTLDGYDFSLDGGWGIVVQAAGTKILNSNLSVGANHQPPIRSTKSASLLYIGYCVIDGNKDPDPSGLIEMLGPHLTVEYSWLKNAGGDIIQLHSGGGNVIIRYNLIENSGMAAGAHGDYTEFLGGPFVATIVYNTTTQMGGTTQGFMVEPDVGASLGIITSGEIGNNTFTANSGINVFTGVTVADIRDTFIVHVNYFDPTNTLAGLSVGGVRGGPNDSSVKSVYVGNVNMLTGAVLQDTKAVAAPTPRH